MKSTEVYPESMDSNEYEYCRNHLKESAKRRMEVKISHVIM
jgi:hypothetical protein